MNIRLLPKILLVFAALISWQSLASVEDFTSDPANLDFFIPLKASTSGDYGNGSSCSNNGIGTCSDHVHLSGGAQSSGWVNLDLEFGVPSSGLSGVDSATLLVNFEDLDLLPYDLGKSKVNFKEEADLIYLKNGDELKQSANTVYIAQLDKSYAENTDNKNDVDGHSIKEHGTNNKELNLKFNLDLNNMFTQIKSGLEIFTVRLKMRAILAHSSQHSSTHKIRNTKESVTAQMRYSTTEVPEPSTIALFLLAMIGIVVTNKRRSLSIPVST